ncbi:MAG: sigma-54-dependent transcriptional regulator [Planctomycetota bacterium]
MDMEPLVLIVDDDPDASESLGEFLELKGYRSRCAGTIQEAANALEEGGIDGMLLDLKLPDGNGLDWIPDLAKQHPHLAILVVTGSGDDVPTAVEAMHRGADQFLTKPINPDQLHASLEKCLELEQLRRRNAARERLAKKENVFLGESKAARRMWDLAESAAHNEAVVLIEGETGSGKGILAKWIHDSSARAEGEFVEVNCSFLGGELLASELFGHRKGAFTGAVENREGLVELANGGTLFLDEIGDMDLAVQAQLLKVIEEKRFRRVGETKPRRSDFRLICATNKDLLAETRAGRFREDLYYRICVFPVRVPPLRERVEDLPALVAHLVASMSRSGREIPETVIHTVSAYEWPGNIRELRNVVERACLLSPEGALTFEGLPGFGDDGAAGASGGDDGTGTEAVGPKGWSLDQQEAHHIRNALEAHNHDIMRTAEALGVSRATLYRKLKKYDLSRGS